MTERPDRDRSFCTTFFAGDRVARDAVNLLSPKTRGKSVAEMDPEDIGREIAELGEQLYREGSMPGLSTWQFEESPEFAKGIQLWKKACVEGSSETFAELVRKASDLAIEGFAQMGNLTPKLSICRWMVAMLWLAMRAALVAASSAGGCFGLPLPAANAKCLKDCKRAVFDRLNELVGDVRIQAIFDFDLVGFGIWLDGGQVPLPEEANNEWYRRGVELDVAMLCHQACRLPPQDPSLDGWRPTIKFVQRFGSPDWVLPPQEVPRRILERHEWLCTLQPIPIEGNTKLLMGGTQVLQTALPPPPIPDLDDPIVVAQIQNGEELSKQHQADGLPGALHGSIGYLYSAMCAEEGIEHVVLPASMTGLQGFVGALLGYGSPMKSMDMSGCYDLVDSEMLQDIIPMAGPRLHTLDLSGCGLDFDLVDEMIECVERLPGLRQLDLAGNGMDAESAIAFVSAIAEKRVDIATLRLDDNPVGDQVDFRTELAGILARRGAQVVAGGTVNFMLGEDESVLWSSKQTPDLPHGRSIALMDKVVSQQDKRLGELEANCEANYQEMSKTGKGFTVAKAKYDKYLYESRGKNQGVREFVQSDYDAAQGSSLPESHLRRGVDLVKPKAVAPDPLDDLETDPLADLNAHLDLYKFGKSS